MDEKETKRTLWENVQARMVSLWGEENVTRLAREAKIGGSASRIKEQETSVGIDVVAKVAEALEAEPFELLLPANDKILQHIVSVYARTGPIGRNTLATAAKIAEAGIGGRGADKSSQADNR